MPRHAQTHRRPGRRGLTLRQAFDAQTGKEGGEADQSKGNSQTSAKKSPARLTNACDRRVRCASANCMIFFCSSSCFRIFSLKGFRLGIPGSFRSFFRSAGFFFASRFCFRSCSLAFLVMLYFRARGVRLDVDPSFMMETIRQAHGVTKERL